MGQPSQDDKDAIDNWLLKEAENAAALTYHIDELRNRLTSFFVGLAGVFIAALSLLIDSDSASPSVLIPPEMVAIPLLFLTFTGFVIIRILARLRHVQLEHFAVIENIRARFLRDSPDREIIGLSPDTLPNRKDRRSGTYFWTLMIIVLTAASATATILLLISHIWRGLSLICVLGVSVPLLGIGWLLLDWWWIVSLGKESIAEQLVLKRRREAELNATGSSQPRNDVKEH